MKDEDARVAKKVFSVGSRLELVFTAIYFVRTFLASCSGFRVKELRRAC